MAKHTITPRPPKGFRDFLPADMIKREYVFHTVREVFELFGFEPLDTPIIELNETLYGKYGEDAEQLIYSAQHGRSSKDETSLRYDLTVPLARVIAQYENEFTFPFKRYQIAPVFRGERPQKGRYREFYQCDADIVGIDFMSADAESIAVVVSALRRLGFDNFSVKINHRRLLNAIGQYSGVPDDQLADLYRSVDKFDKIGGDGVREELIKRGIEREVVARMIDLITSQQSGIENLDYLEETLGNQPDAQASLSELRQLAEFLDDLGVLPSNYAFDLTMVRGLSYYTGPIFETVVTEPNIGSLSGGGRYDELIGMFRRESLPTTGVSLGIERIIDVMEELDLYPAHVGGTVVDVLVTVFSDETRHAAARIASRLRQEGIRTELFLDDRNLGKQFKHADRKGIPLVAVAGPDEIEQDVVTLRRLRDGQEVQIKVEALPGKVREWLA